MYRSNALISCESKDMRMCSYTGLVYESVETRFGWCKDYLLQIIQKGLKTEEIHHQHHHRHHRSIISHTHTFSLCPHQSGVPLGLPLLGRQEVHLCLVTLQKLPADVKSASSERVKQSCSRGSCIHFIQVSKYQTSPQPQNITEYCHSTTTLKYVFQLLVL